jgi:acetyltransferase-like isoleucine patch superfamily enzyme
MLSTGGTWANARLYVSRQASSPVRYVVEQLLFALVGWVPTIVGIGLRAVLYRLILGLEGVVAIENGVRIRFASNIRLGRGVYLDRGAYLHACVNGIALGSGTFVMHGAVLHVYNFRDIPHSGISVGRNCLIGEYSVLRGQGGITIGDNVYTAPHVQMLAVEHVHDDPSRPVVDQGITAQGIVVEDDAWIGAGALILDGVRVGKGAVVGAGAVVTRDVPPHAVVAGVPAEVVRAIDGTAGPERGDVYW